MENTARHALELLRNRMTGADLRQLSDTDLAQFEAICDHWQALATAEKKSRATTIRPTFAGKRGRHGG